MIGRLLDKYKILEEVGQGGMAVVYKATDTQLHREVAVKVLHPHLASHLEARRRFEREAQAVAKLRHENILEIFDYSGKDSSESYIVTEFIRGATLKGFMTDHVLGFPELAAMITAEVCRALSHAHALGVLHRDVKPENIMIRDDGIVKLTDFGIAQIVDAQRMTVTGQLMGSPAYMSPEHVEGRPLDFRTDVFSVGILLYQLATNELPFTGKNPHEILKRIAECKYTDARQVNPKIADKLNRIIAKALARLPDDRYADVPPMLEELQHFLAEAELGEPRGELIRFFENPVSYEQALRQRLISALTKRGRMEIEGKRTSVALELFNRVLTIDPQNEEILAEIDKLTARKRVARFAIIASAVLVVGGAVVMGSRALSSSAGDLDRPPPAVALVSVATAHSAPTAPAALAVDAGAAMVMAVRQDGAPSLTPTAVLVHKVQPPVTPRETAKDPPHKDPAVENGPDRVFAVAIMPVNASFTVDGGGDQRPTHGGRIDLPLGSGAHTLVFHHAACDDFVVHVAADEAAHEIVVHLPFKPAQIVPVCPDATAITVDGRSVDSGTALDIRDFQTSSKTISVEFLVGGHTVDRSVKVAAGGPRAEVSCVEEP